MILAKASDTDHFGIFVSSVRSVVKPFSGRQLGRRRGC
jgi:hypothetical protein